MADQRPGPPPPPEERHEHSDANAVGMIKIGVGLLLLLAAVLAVAYGILRLMEVFPPKPTTQPSALENPNALPPEPRLQVNPPVDLMNYRHWEDSMLATYGWVDRDRGTVRVPVESAIVIAARKGFPVDPAAAAALKKEAAEYGAAPGADTVSRVSGGPLEPETSAPPETTTRRGTREVSPKAAHGGAKEDQTKPK